MLVQQENTLEVSWLNILSNNYSDRYSITDYTIEIQNYTLLYTDTEKSFTAQFKLKVQYLINNKFR